MYSKITQLRQRGSRRPSREINDDAGVLGAVTLHGSGMHLCMQLSEWGVNNGSGLLLPTLWDARCVSWHSGLMVWHGYQAARMDSQKGDAVYFQEWRVEVLGMAPDSADIRSPFFARNSADM
jgi:hypothetical protein